MISEKKYSQEETEKSRSQKKRESTALQQQGEELASLSPAIWKKLPLSPELAEALPLWRTLKSREAKRRHMQYIGRLMREMDTLEELLDALESIRVGSASAQKQFAHLESLRNALLDSNEQARATALEQLFTEFPALERNKVVHLIEASLADREKNRPPKHARELFRYLRDG